MREMDQAAILLPMCALAALWLRFAAAFARAMIDRGFYQHSISLAFRLPGDEYGRQGTGGLRDKVCRRGQVGEEWNKTCVMSSCRFASRRA
jgi:hypothetical protein